MTRTIALALSFLLLPAAAQAEGVRIEGVAVYEGTCDAAGAVALPEGSFGDRFLMVDSADSILRIYAVGTPDMHAGTDVGATLSGGNRGGIDIEAATWLDGEALLVGTLGRDPSGVARDADWQFLSVAVADDHTVHARPGRSDRLLAGLAALDPDLDAAIGDLGADDPELAPDRGGINLEGMSVAADGASLFLGFRNPVPAGQSILVKLLNPKAVLFEDAEPAFEPPIRLDLGGRGIRSMEYAPTAAAYFIVAGPAQAEGDFDLYRWVEGGTPLPVPGAREALASLPGFAPDGLIIDQTGTRLQLFSDDQDCTGDSFHSAVLTLE